MFGRKRGAEDVVTLPAQADAKPPSTAAEFAARWRPVIVGRAIPDFEARPAAAIAPRPDTIVDGWSTAAFTLRAASVRGYQHRYDGTPRQDEFAVGAHPQGPLAIAVADGVSSAEHSHLGAATVCRYALDFLFREIDRGDGEIRWLELLRGAAYALLESARRTVDPTVDGNMVERLFATTLVAGVVAPLDDGTSQVTLIQVGDSGAWALAAGAFVPLLDTKSSPDDALLSNAVSGLPRIPDPAVPTSLTLAPGQTLLIGTDGFGDPLGHGDGAVGQLFAAALATPPPQLGFAHLLDFSRETFDDDRTLVAVWVNQNGAP